VLAGKPDVRFLTSAEIGDICRRGWSLRRCGAERILRYRRPERGEVRLDGPVKRIAALPGGAACRFADDAGTAVFAASEGDYLIE